MTLTTADHARSSEDGNERPTLIAYRLANASLELVPAPANRPWMTGVEAFGQRYAYRCLPLLIANQSGWLIVNHDRLFVIWSGGATLQDLKVTYQSGEPPYPAASHFGYGILTWRIPYLFRTPPGYNLLVRGPANWPKDGIAPLEGVVETDWAEATFTMNWKVTRPNQPIIFGPGEPICMILPQKRGELESFLPEARAIEAEPELQRGHDLWRASRDQFQEEARDTSSEALRKGWQRHYFDGVTVSGSQAPEHQQKLHLRPFDEV